MEILNPQSRSVLRSKNDNKTSILSTCTLPLKEKRYNARIKIATIPNMYMMIGLPGSGKSVYAKLIYNQYPSDAIAIHSSDDLREELYGDVNNQENNTDLFVELHKRIKTDLKNGKSVIYDATNISKKRRIAFLQELKNIPCVKIAICMMTPFEKCLGFNSIRKRVVPENVIKKMYMNWCPPYYHEGFDYIFCKYYSDNIINHMTATNLSKKRYDIGRFFEKIDNFNQDNEHHRLTLGEHCSEAYIYLLKNHAEKVLRVAGLLHDIGKVFTKTYLNAKGKYDGNCHYYNHENVGAYDSMFFTENNYDFTNNERLYIANLIYYHMRPYLSWKQSEKAKKRDMNIIGEKMFNDVVLLHNADVAAH